MEFKLAPIVLFAFNRLDCLKVTVESVLKNPEAANSPLYVFVDGARSNKAGEVEKVKAVQEYVKTITGFKSLHYHFSDLNKGLGPSIISGVQQIINQYGRVIVIEDDLVLAPNCLSFMNQGLSRYESIPKVFSICGYSNVVTIPMGYKADAYFCVRSSSWGWATWADRWNSVDWDLTNWDSCKSNNREFNKWGGSDCYSMLLGWKEGRNKSWAIRFCYAQFLQNKLSLFPIISKVKNDGFDGEGTNCRKYNRFKYKFDESKSTEFVFPESIEINNTIYKSFKSYFTITSRFWSRVMNIILK